MPTVYQDERPAHVQFPNTATEAVLHNHDYQDTSRGDIHYAGYSDKNPSYHLFVCIAHSKPPRNKNLHLQPYERLAFTPESKAGRGGCSMRGCHEEAVNMNERGTKAYCARCSDRSTNTVPCPWTSILPCATIQSGGYCRTCDLFEKGGP
jgi:hypothetical protein